MSKTKVLICPYCGDAQAAGDRCRSCGGFFEPLSRQATHNAMGPWFVRDERRPFQPGCSYETLVKLIERKAVTKFSIVRGPTTKQFWTVARRVPGISHLLGYCHNCDASVDASDHGCHACGVPFGAYLDRNFLGLPDVRPLPWEAPVEDDSPHSASSSRMMQFNRAAEPLGISSFASDEELRAEGLTPISNPSGPPAMPAVPKLQLVGDTDALDDNVDGDGEVERNGATTGTGAAALSSAAPSSAPPADVSADSTRSTPSTLASTFNSVALHSMQRRLQKQQRTIRLLAVALSIVTVIGAAAIVMAVRNQQGTLPAISADSSHQLPAGVSSESLPDANSQGTTSLQGETITPPDAGSGNTVADEAIEADALDPAGEDSDGDVNAQSPIIDDSGVVDDEALLPNYAEVFESAQEQLALGKQTDKSLDERIAHYEEALRILRDIAARAPADQQPEDLDSIIKQAEYDLERLKLQRFFP